MNREFQARLGHLALEDPLVTLVLQDQRELKVHRDRRGLRASWDLPAPRDPRAPQERLSSPCP